MKAIAALCLLKRKGLIDRRYTLRGLKMTREVFSFGEGGLLTWPEFVRSVMLTRYFDDSFDLSEKISVPEVGFAIGGTVTINIGRLEANE